MHGLAKRKTNAKSDLNDTSGRYHEYDEKENSESGLIKRRKLDSKQSSWITNDKTYFSCVEYRCALLNSGRHFDSSLRCAPTCDCCQVIGETLPRFLVNCGVTTMPGAREINDSTIDTSHNGLSPPFDQFTPRKDTTDTVISAQDITKVQRARRLNEYITIPRRPRLHPQNRKDYVETTISPRHVTRVNSSEDDSVKPEDSGSQEKHERTWSFKKLKHALGKSKSPAKKDAEESEAPDESGDSDECKSLPTYNREHLRTEEKRPIHVSQSYSDLKRTDSGIYSELDVLQMRRCSQSPRDSSDRSSCGTGSSNSMAGVGSMERRSSVPTAEPKNVVGKVLSSLSNLTARRKSPRKQKQSIENVDYSGDFSRENYRDSFKQPISRSVTYSNNDARRAKSFSASSRGQVHTSAPEPLCMEVDEGHSSQSHYDVAGDDGIYSLARSDSPPPLPERTYLKLRNQNPLVLDQPNMGYDATGKYISYGAKEANNNVPGTHAGHHSSIPDRPHHTKKPLHFPCETGYPTAKPFMLHSHLQNELGHTTASSGYGSVNSDNFSQGSVDSDFTMTSSSNVPTACNLPKRSRHVSRGLQMSRGTGQQDMEHYSNREAETSLVRVTRDMCPMTPVELRHSDSAGSTSTISDLSLDRNKVHNLPLLPDQAQAQLIRTIHLDNVLKDRWISGVAVTKKNEYIVVDQREAYLLEEDGTFKKSIGSKGSTRLIEPLNVTVASNGNLVFCDHAEQDVKMYTWKGQFIRKIKEQGLTNIAGIAVTEDRHIVIAGTDKKRVSIMDEEGSLLYTIPGESPGEKISPKKSPFEHPYSIAINPLTGDIIVGDDTKQVVTAVAPRKDGQPPRILWRYSPGSGNRHFFPSSICADNNGYIFIADLYNEMVYMLDSGGKLVKTLLSKGNGLKGGPGAIATDGKGHLLVADEERTLKVFRYDDEKGFAVNTRYSFCPHAS